MGSEAHKTVTLTILKKKQNKKNLQRTEGTGGEPKKSQSPMEYIRKKR